ncbi:MAG: hypothetical protein DRP42_04475 [Tenericutes bacterium]|nr:MAG: hypothetical protein DRP42_04475 [Mycoplasmatota bacterium]
MTDQTAKEIFDAGIEQGDNKNTIVTEMILKGGLDVTVALREYMAFARDSGLILSREEKDKSIVEVLHEADLKTKEGVEAARDALTAELDVAPSTAMNYIRAFAKENDLELPIGQRKTFATKEEVVAFIIENQESSRSDISKGLIAEFGYAKGTADTICSHIVYMIEYSNQVSA